MDSFIKDFGSSLDAATEKDIVYMAKSLHRYNFSVAKPS